RIVIKTGLGRAVGGEMLDASEQMFARFEVAALKTPDPRRGEQTPKKHVLAASLDASAPALVASNVDHWREGPVDARAGRLERRRLGGPACKLRLEARHLRE